MPDALLLHYIDHLIIYEKILEGRFSFYKKGNCYGLHCAHPQINMLKSYLPKPLNVTVFGDRTFKGVTKVK